MQRITTTSSTVKHQKMEKLFLIDQLQEELLSKCVEFKHSIKKASAVSVLNVTSFTSSLLDCIKLYITKTGTEREIFAEFARSYSDSDKDSVTALESDAPTFQVDLN